MSWTLVVTLVFAWGLPDWSLRLPTDRPYTTLADCQGVGQLMADWLTQDGVEVQWGCWETAQEERTMLQQERPHYEPQLMALAAQILDGPPGAYLAVVRHDDWCQLLTSGARCDCNPTVEFQGRCTPGADAHDG